MLLFLEKLNSFNFGDMILVFIAFISLFFFLVRSGLYLFFVKFGIAVNATIVSYDKVTIRRYHEAYDFVYAYRYRYEYQAHNGKVYSGFVQKYFLSPVYSIDEEIPIQCLKNNPQKSRYYTIRDWFAVEFISLIISLVLFSVFFLFAHPTIFAVNISS